MTTTPIKVIGVMNSVSWSYRGVSIDKNKRGYEFRVRRSDGFGIGYKGDAYNNLATVAQAIDEMLDRSDVTIVNNAIVIAA